ncbi:flavin reductase family protein [Sediminicola luteus]|uniref:Flavin oxidoreductase n=1 Tax=Sediminicola luteus TaxID=319238 RepID=A0A2A4G8M8_9FLAO|nr:flavin reductase [Sediminicola luteus]PCE64783.1 flavin oxidoreductase [Sediminicola luteus]
MISFDHKKILELPRRYRAQLINSLSGYKSANLIGTVDAKDQENLGLFSSVVHIGAHPPLLGFILRPTTVPRHTFENIKETGYYTINHICRSIIRQAHHSSAKYEKTISEFTMTGLGSVYKTDFPAPYVAESPIQIGLQFVEAIPIPANQTQLIVGSIEEIHLSEEILREDGAADLSKADIAALIGLDTYVTPNTPLKLDYQKPLVT